MTKLPTVLIITNIPTPYRIPLFNELSRQLAEKNIHLRVLFGALGYERRKWKVSLDACAFDYVVLPSRSFKARKNESVSFSYSGLFKEIRNCNPVAIITNGFSVATMKLWLRGWYSSIPVIIWSGEISNKHRPVSALRKLQRQVLIRRANGFVVYGSMAKDYLVSLGAKPESVAIGFNTVDTKYFADAAKMWPEKWQDNQKFNLLYVGNLTANKRVDLLLQVVTGLSTNGKYNNYILRIVGDGPERAFLEQQAEELGIKHLVMFEGFQQKSQIKDYLVQAHCFLFPSEYDIWGLVLVEAMAAGVPCIASPESGATVDLIRDPDSGYSVNFDNTPLVVDRLKVLIGNRQLAEQIGRNAAQRIASEFSIGVSAKGFVEAYEKVLINVGK